VKETAVEQLESKRGLHVQQAEMDQIALPRRGAKRKAKRGRKRRSDEEEEEEEEGDDAVEADSDVVALQRSDGLDFDYSSLRPQMTKVGRGA
jgi:hypothetical protein